jgi:replicative DNA helicase
MSSDALADNKVPPHSLEVERTVLASILVDTRQIPTVLGKLTVSAFYATAHKFIFRAIGQMYDEGQDIDIVLLADQLKATGNLDKVGGEAYLGELMQDVSTTASIENHCNVLFEYQLRREIILKAHSTLNLAYKLDKEIADVISDIEGIGLEMAEKCDSGGIGRNSPGKIVSVSEMRSRVDEYREFGFTNVGVDPGPGNMEQYFRIAKGFMTVVTGMPFHGKSEIMEQIMVHTAAAKGWKWGVFSPENYPYIFLMEKMVQKYTGKAFRKELDQEEYDQAMKWLDQHFTLIEPNEDKTTVTDLIRMINQIEVDAMLIDPWNRLVLDRMQGENLADATGRHLDRMQWVTRKKHIATCIVTHPKVMLVETTGKNKGAYPVVKPYDLYGGSMWANKADNILSVYRNFDNKVTQVHIQKVKFKAHGKAPATLDYLYCDPPGIFMTKDEIAAQREKDRRPDLWN